MRFLNSTKILVGLALAYTCVAPTHASSPFSGLKQLIQTEPAFQSRTCGLVLLSNGRAQVRSLKAARAQTLEPALNQLTRAFMLLRDGRGLTSGHQGPRNFFQEHLSTGTTTKPLYQALPEAVEYCEWWFNARRAKPDFDRSDQANAESVAQAQMTLETE